MLSGELAMNSGVVLRSRTGPAPIAEPEEVTDVSVQASSVSLNEATAPTVGARDEPDVHVHYGPDRLFQRLRQMVRRPLSSLREMPWWPITKMDSTPHHKTGNDRWWQPRRFRHRFCPPFRVAGEEAAVVQESEFSSDSVFGYDFD